MSAPAFLVLGDVGWDEYVDEPAERPGGCAANVACALVAAGARGVAVAAPVGADGEPLRALLAARGVDVSLVEVVAGGPSSRQRIRLRPDGERDFCGYAGGVLAGWTPRDAARRAIRAAGLVYVATFDATRALAEEVLALRAGRPVALDLMNLSDHDDAYTASAVARARFVFAGLDEKKDGARIELLARAAGRPGAALVVVTLGPRGARAYGPGGPVVAIDAAPVPGGRVVDTTGCGDAFAGTFLALEGRGVALPGALEGASAAAAVVAARRGAIIG